MHTLIHPNKIVCLIANAWCPTPSFCYDRGLPTHSHARSSPAYDTNALRSDQCPPQTQLHAAKHKPTTPLSCPRSHAHLSAKQHAARLLTITHPWMPRQSPSRQAECAAGAPLEIQTMSGLSFRNASVSLAAKHRRPYRTVTPLKTHPMCSHCHQAREVSPTQRRAR